MNALERSYYNDHFTLVMSTHYLVKLKRHTAAHFEASHHSIVLLNSKNVVHSFVSLLAENLSGSRRF